MVTSVNEFKLTSATAVTVSVWHISHVRVEPKVDDFRVPISSRTYLKTRFDVKFVFICPTYCPLYPIFTKDKTLKPLSFFVFLTPDQLCSSSF
ncbi:hypothetical protein VNO77_09645 [Canavalia gladiata]|uniref:Uncharacterized protein n=1 Tax=Canavalia gladiata TaxID=3824 RepID=A0AAN9QXG3_CANGL